MCVRSLAELFCTLVPFLPHLFQGVSASDLPTNRYTVLYYTVAVYLYLYY